MSAISQRLVPRENAPEVDSVRLSRRAGPLASLSLHLRCHPGKCFHFRVVKQSDHFLILKVSEKTPLKIEGLGKAGQFVRSVFTTDSERSRIEIYLCV